jgi:hypothetical protein
VFENTRTQHTAPLGLKDRDTRDKLCVGEVSSVIAFGAIIRTNINAGMVPELQDAADHVEAGSPFSRGLEVLGEEIVDWEN